MPSRNPTRECKFSSSDAAKSPAVKEEKNFFHLARGKLAQTETPAGWHPKEEPVEAAVWATPDGGPLEAT